MILQCSNALIFCGFAFILLWSDQLLLILLICLDPWGFAYGGFTWLIFVFQKLYFFFWMLSYCTDAVALLIISFQRSLFSFKGSALFITLFCSVLLHWMITFFLVLRWSVSTLFWSGWSNTNFWFVYFDLTVSCLCLFLFDFAMLC